MPSCDAGWVDTGVAKDRNALWSFEISEISSSQTHYHIQKELNFLLQGH